MAMASCARQNHGVLQNQTTNDMDGDDGSDNRRIASLSKLMRALQNCRTPSETLTTIRRSLGEAYGSTAMMMLSTRGLRTGEYRLVQMELDANDSDDDIAWAREQSPIRAGGVVATIIGNPQTAHRQ